MRFEQPTTFVTTSLVEIRMHICNLIFDGSSVDIWYSHILKCDMDWVKMWHKKTANLHSVRFLKVHTVKLGYTELLGTSKICCLKPVFVITRVLKCTNHVFGTQQIFKFVHYNREFVTTEFVITKFDCEWRVLQNIKTTQNRNMLVQLAVTCFTMKEFVIHTLAQWFPTFFLLRNTFDPKNCHGTLQA
jgi:hypothetical protein